MRFLSEEVERLDRLWRALPPHHEWTGWACSGSEPDQIYVFRTRAHWRRFALQKTPSGFALVDEHDSPTPFDALGDAPAVIASVPGLAPI